MSLLEYKIEIRQHEPGSWSSHLYVASDGAWCPCATVPSRPRPLTATQAANEAVEELRQLWEVGLNEN